MGRSVSPAFKPRTRIVSFRVSEEEYRELMSRCAIEGARSVSDLTRSITLRYVTGATAFVAEGLRGMAEQIQARLGRLDEAVRQLAERR